MAIMPGAGGPPPSIQLGGGGAPNAGGPPQGAGGGTPGEPDNPIAEGALKRAIAAVEVYMKAEQDEQDKHMAAKVMAQLQGLMAGRQKQADAAMGTSPALAFVRRQAQGG